MRRSLRRWLLPMTVIAATSCNEMPVELPKASTVTVSPAAVTLTIGDVAEVTAHVLDQKGLSFSGALPVWSSNHPEIAFVKNGGDGTAVLQGVTVGAAVVTATAPLVVLVMVLTIVIVMSVPPVSVALGGSKSQALPSWTILLVRAR